MLSSEKCCLFVFSHQKLYKKLSKIKQNLTKWEEISEWVMQEGSIGQEAGQEVTEPARPAPPHARGIGMGKMTAQAGITDGIAMRILAHNSAQVHLVYIRPSYETIRKGMKLIDDIDI